MIDTCNDMIKRMVVAMSFRITRMKRMQPHPCGFCFVSAIASGKIHPATHSIIDIHLILVLRIGQQYRWRVPSPALAVRFPYETLAIVSLACPAPCEAKRYRLRASDTSHREHHSNTAGRREQLARNACKPAHYLSCQTGRCYSLVVYTRG